MLKNISQIYRPLFIIALILMNIPQSNGRTVIQLNGEDWVGRLPTDVIHGFAFFDLPQFSQGLPNLKLDERWQSFIQNYQFVQPIEKVDDFMVIIGQSRYPSRKMDDIVIFVDSLLFQVAAICKAYVVSEWYVPYNWDGITPYQVASSPAYMQITYYPTDQPPISLRRPLDENCANGNAQLAVERWREITP